MRRFRFENICLVSLKEQRARKVTFHKKLNLIAGRNHTGKSSLIKSLFVALGARPTGKLDRWDKDAVALLTFTIDGIQFRALQQHSNRALFNTEGRLLYVADSAGDWGRKFCEVT